MVYFVIHNSEGDTTVEALTKEELLERLTPDEDLNYYYGGNGECLGNIDNSDTNYWGDSLLIIKGEIVTPTAVKVIEKVDIE